MKILIVGSGATGGAFGTHLTEGGREVNYLVRPARATALREHGLRFVSPSGDRVHPVTAIVAGEPLDDVGLIILAVKATGLQSALADVAPYITEHTKILPVLNGMSHLAIAEQLYPGHVIGGLARIVATVDAEGTVHQLTPLSALTVGSLNGEALPAQLIESLTVPGIQLHESRNIRGALWAKWSFIAAAGVIGCLFRGPIGAILNAGGEATVRAAITECETVAEAAGYPVPESAHQQAVGMMTEPGSAFTSSLYRDLAAGARTEAEHILGGYSAEARRLGVDTPLLDLALIQTRVVESQLS